MHSNVNEWCNGKYDDLTHSIRVGYFHSGAEACGCDSRSGRVYEYKCFDVGVGIFKDN